jgi:hypothetical protein
MASLESEGKFKGMKSVMTASAKASIELSEPPLAASSQILVENFPLEIIRTGWVCGISYVKGFAILLDAGDTNLKVNRENSGIKNHGEANVVVISY